MDLRNGRITVEELLANPKARTLLQKECPGALQSPMLTMARGMPLGQVLALAQGRFPQSRIDGILAQLRQL